MFLEYFPKAALERDSDQAVSQPEPQSMKPYIYGETMEGLYVPDYDLDMVLDLLRLGGPRLRLETARAVDRIVSRNIMEERSNTSGALYWHGGYLAYSRPFRDQLSPSRLLSGERLEQPNPFGVTLALEEGTTVVDCVNDRWKLGTALGIIGMSCDLMLREELRDFSVVTCRSLGECLAPPCEGWATRPLNDLIAEYLDAGQKAKDIERSAALLGTAPSRDLWDTRDVFGVMHSFGGTPRRALPGCSVPLERFIRLSREALLTPSEPVRDGGRCFVEAGPEITQRVWNVSMPCSREVMKGRQGGIFPENAVSCCFDNNSNRYLPLLFAQDADEETYALLPCTHRTRLALCAYYGLPREKSLMPMPVRVEAYLELTSPGFADLWSNTLHCPFAGYADIRGYINDAPDRPLDETPVDELFYKFIF
jgi:hypothetical protein